MRKNIFSISITLVLVFLVINGCKKKDTVSQPVISFLTGASYTQNGAIVMVGHRLSFGIHAQGIGADITNITVKKVLSNGTVVTMKDTGLYTPSIDLNMIFFQNVEDVATWQFTAMDRDRMSAQISLVVYKDPNSTFGGIYTYSVTMGYQNNTTFGHFLNPNTGLVYSNTDSATAHCKLLDVLIYYIDDANSNNTPSPVLSSPGEMDNASTEAETFYPYITSWSPRNYTLWDISFDNGTNAPLTLADFNVAQNDSLLIVSYHPAWGKKKFRWGLAGKIVPFLTTAGKLGLVYIARADSADTGIMQLSIKIQQ